MYLSEKTPAIINDIMNKIINNRNRTLPIAALMNMKIIDAIDIINAAIKTFKLLKLSSLSTALIPV